MANEINFNWHVRLYRYVPLILCVALVLFLAGSAASMENTAGFLRPLLEILFPYADDTTLLAYIVYLRKFCHIAEYCVLALLAVRAFATSSKDFLRNWWYLAALALVIIIAAVDESIQSFNPLRTGTVFDVAIDLSGGLLGILGCAVLMRVRGSLKTLPIEQVNAEERG